MSSERQNKRDSVTGSEVMASQLFNFGPDVDGPATGPQAALPPWMADQARLARETAQPPAGQTLSARFAGAPSAVATDLDVEDVTPEPVVVPEFARTVPAPRKRRKPVPADRVVIAAPAVVDGSGNVVMSPGDAGINTGINTGINAGIDAGTATGTSPVLLPAQRTEVGAAAPGTTVPAKSAPRRARPRWINIAQAAAIIGVGAGVGIYASGGLSFLQHPTGQTNPPTAEAGAWVLNNLAGAGTVLLPSSMADGLIANGQDGDALTTYTDGSVAPLDLGKNCCSYLVIVGAPGQEAGSGLPDSVHTLFERSRPAAVFTTAGGWTQVRQVLPGSPSKVAKDLEADHAALVATGKSLIASGKVELSDVAKAQVQNGEVDARVLIGVVAVALQHQITIASFPAQPGESDAGILRRSVAISAIDGKVVKDGSDRVNAVKAQLAAQTGIYHPAGAEVHPIDGVSALEFRYDAPSPFGVLTLNDSGGNAA